VRVHCIGALLPRQCELPRGVAACECTCLTTIPGVLWCARALAAGTRQNAGFKFKLEAFQIPFDHCHPGLPCACLACRLSAALMASLPL
jgi:hypothetical protein